MADDGELFVGDRLGRFHGTVGVIAHHHLILIEDTIGLKADNKLGFKTCMDQ